MSALLLRYRGAIIALTATTAWATTAIFIGYLYKHYDIQPLTLAFWRDLFVALTLLLVLRIGQPAALKITRRDVPFFLAYGFVGMAVFNGLWSYSVLYNGAAVATVLAYSSPAFTVLLARPILNEPFTPRKLIAVVLSLAGCVFVAKAYSAEQWQLNPTGILVGLGTGLAFAFYNLAGRWSAKRFNNAWTVTTYGFLFASFGLALGVLFIQGPASALSLGSAWSGWAILAVLAIGPTIAGFGLYTVSLRYLQASVVGLIATLEPVLTAIMAIVLLGERLDEKQLLGAALILLAVILVQGESATSETPTVVVREA